MEVLNTHGADVTAEANICWINTLHDFKNAMMLRTNLAPRLQDLPLIVQRVYIGNESILFA